MRLFHSWDYKRLACIALLPGSMLFTNQVIAGAWVPEQGSGYTKIGYSEYEADSSFDDNSDLENFEGTNISFYGEYGLGNKISVYTSVLYQDIEQVTRPVVATDPLVRSANDGFGDLEAGVKYQWQANPFVFSTSFLVKLPYLYDEDDTLPLGNGQNDYEIKALIGKSLNEYGYFGVEAGYRLRSGSPSDEYRYLLEYGFSANDNLYFRTKLDGTLSANNADQGVDSNGVNLAFSPEFDIGKLELTTGWNFGQADSNGQRWGIELTYTNEIYGSNALDGDSIQLGITRVF